MLSLIRKLSAGIAVPVLWTIVVIILLCIPGSDLPEDELLKKIENFDKLVHLILFGGIVLFWGTWKHLHDSNDRTWFKFICTLTLSTIILGIAMEYVQLYLVANRDFDRADISADSAGALAAFGYLIMVRRK
ncbi:MAG: hypothetical protein EOO02_22010 [Chitinophagaceae bacterium]|nr:MAG: hypothetical protein EOO02_22010 [Chitinophagaceae bacterium]